MLDFTGEIWIGLVDYDYNFNFDYDYDYDYDYNFNFNYNYKGTSNYFFLNNSFLGAKVR